MSDQLARIQRELGPYVRRLTKDRYLAEEITQDAWIKCRPYEMSLDPDTLKKLMFAILRNGYLSACRKLKHEKSALARLGRFPQRCSPCPEADVEGKELAHQVRRCILMLPSNYREVIYRIFWLGQTNEQVAMEMGQCLSTIKTWRRRARNQLAVFLAPFVEGLT